ncbi:hypothetical protein [Pseudovibrio sp. Tun.PSC04-5.I4]|uniref:hypothetical protein n=1 Tax=Pseudovibrio sp. Tun.PSC04-5.I4 TaxID=1798213 RepID=UPI0008858161|nr:hypothetical protein [Pseudovibrio sp. Tun.PSC04-5.I4]SDR39984.1 hypothetical protein SAMN04515695_5373 [Pseudovibrio sp. Tun.PSC04-5.I4]
MGLSRRAYAAHRKALGLSGRGESAVRKAIQFGRVTLEADGSIDPVKADAEWEASTDNAKRRQHKRSRVHPPQPAAPTAIPESADPIGSSQGITYAKARAANEALKAQRSKLLLQQLKGELIDRRAAVNHVFDLARKERDSWLQLPARVAANMAAELGVDAHKMEQLLDEVIRDHLARLSEIKIELSG